MSLDRVVADAKSDVVVSDGVPSEAESDVVLAKVESDVVLATVESDYLGGIERPENLHIPGQERRSHRTVYDPMIV